MLRLWTNWYGEDGGPTVLKRAIDRYVEIQFSSVVLQSAAPQYRESNGLEVA